MGGGRQTLYFGFRVFVYWLEGWPDFAVMSCLLAIMIVRPEYWRGCSFPGEKYVQEAVDAGWRLCRGL
jgi:hypothetical protein